MIIKLSGNLLRFSNFRNEIMVNAPSVITAIEQLVTQLPGLKKVLLDAQGGPRAIHRMFLNGDLLERQDFDRAAEQSDELSILTAIAGG
jgi:molybdopterin converting factor small subunit